MASTGIGVAEELLDYLGRHGARTDGVLERVRAETADLPHPEMLVSAEQGALIELLVRVTAARSAIELGTFTGYSAICIARGLAPGGRLLCLENDPEFAAIAERNLAAAGVADRVRIRVAAAADSLRQLDDSASFDFAFIDADKPSYGDYYESILARMRPGGLMLLDNMLYAGRVLAPDTPSARAIDALNRRIHADERVDVAMTTCVDGLTLVRAR